MAINVRVTQQSISTRVLTGLQHNQSRLADLQEKLSSGRQLNRPSDSPTGTVSALQLRGEIRAVQQYQRNADNGLGWLGTLDSTLTSMSDQVNRARDLTLQGMSSGSGASVQSREALASEIDHLRESLIGLANTTYLNRPVFGGDTAGPKAYDPATGTFAPTAPVGTVERVVAADSPVRVDLTGPEAFGADGDPDQLFAVLAQIATHLRTDPGQLSTDLANLDIAQDRLQTQLSGVGARYNRVSTMQQTAEDRLLTLSTQLSDVEDIDLPQTVMDLRLQETAYEAALAASAKVIQPSLMDFLR